MAKSVNGTPGEKGKENECTFGKAELEDRRVRFILRYETSHRRVLHQVHKIVKPRNGLESKNSLPIS